MKIEFNGPTDEAGDPHGLIITREDGDPRAPTEPHFWHQLRNAMQKLQPQQSRRRQWVRVQPHKMAMTSMPYGLMRRTGNNRVLMIIDNDYMLRQAHKPYNERQPVKLAFHHDIDKPEK